MKIEITATYPVRYAAFETSGVLFVNASPQKSGGNEWAIYNDDQRQIYGAIVSCQDKHLAVEVVRHGRAKDISHHWRSFFHEEFELAKQALIAALESAT